MSSGSYIDGFEPPNDTTHNPYHLCWTERSVVMKSYLVSSAGALVFFLLTRFHIGDAFPIPKPPQSEKELRPIIPLVSGNAEGGNRAVTADMIAGKKVNMPKSFVPEGTSLQLWVPKDTGGLDSVINIVGLMRTAIEGRKTGNTLSTWIWRLKSLDVWKGKEKQIPPATSSKIERLKGSELKKRKRLIKKIVEKHNKGEWFKPERKLEEEIEDLWKENHVPPGAEPSTMVSGQIQHYTSHISAPVQAVHSSGQRQHPGSDAFPSPVQNTHSVHGGGNDPTVSTWMNMPIDVHTTGGYQTGHVGGSYNQPINMLAFVGGADHTPPTISAFPPNLQNIDHPHPYQPLESKSHSNTQLGYLPYDPSFDMGVPPVRPSGGIPVGGFPGYQSSPHHQPFPLVQGTHMNVVHSQHGQHEQEQNGPVHTYDWNSHPANINMVQGTHMNLEHGFVMTQGGQQNHGGGSVPAAIPHQDIYNANHLLSGVGITPSNMNMGFSHTMTDYPQDGQHDHGYDIGALMGDHSYDHIYNNLGYGGGLYDPHLMTLEHPSKTGYL